MKTITFTCETITPMFLSGADQNVPELRPPSIKGALRFWWRAMNGHLSLEDLKQKEDEIFGGTDGRSRVLVRVQILNTTEILGKDILGYGVNNSFEGVKYLLYILFYQQSERNGFNKGTKFKIILSGHNENYLKDFCDAFWLFVNIGSIGTRARRGAGAIYVSDIEDKHRILDNYLIFKQINGQSMTDFFNQNLIAIKNRYPNHKKNEINMEYSTVSKHIYISKNSFDTWQKCLEDIGLQMRNLRKGVTHREKSKRTFTMETLDQKAAFGLPISVFQDNIVKLKISERRASPIYISVIKNENGKFHWVVTFLQGNFMPKDDSITFSSKKVNFTNDWEKVNKTLVTKFIEKIKPLSTQVNY